MLIHGFGREGESSLAARIADRLPQHKPVIFEQYDAKAIFDAVLRAVPPDERMMLQKTWQQAITEDEENLLHALEAILSGPCAAYDPVAKRQPVLLITGDLETSALEQPAPGAILSPVKALYQAPFRAMLEAFERANTNSYLLLRSRYEFSLRNNKGVDLARRLHTVYSTLIDKSSNCEAEIQSGKIQDHLRGTAILDARAKQNKPYHAVLSYWHDDFAEINSIALRLERERRFCVWLDKWVASDKERWQQEVEQELSISNTRIIFLGQSTPKEWFTNEIYRSI